MRKIFFMIIACTCLSMGGFAQISEGITNSTVIRTGNRPGAGTFGIYVGPSLNDILNLVDKNVSWRGFPIVNFKYYHSSQLEFRLGLQFYSISTKTKGTILVDNGVAPTFNTRTKESYNRITPGVAYHFSSKNIVDVYLGASVLLGYDIDIKDWTSSDDVAMVNKVKRTSFVMGGEAFIGLQCFVADLPLAIGLEYGISALGELGQKYKHEVGSRDGSTSTQIFYTLDGQFGSTEYSKLSSTKGNVGNDVRLTISYYFHNNK